jgi:hypothetical protein
MWRETRKSKYFSLVLQNGSLGFKQVKRIPKDKYLDDDVLDLPVPELNALVLNTGAPGIAQDLVDRGVPSGLLLRGPQKKAPWTLFLGPGSHVKVSRPQTAC